MRLGTPVAVLGVCLLAVAAIPAAALVGTGTTSQDASTTGATPTVIDSCTTIDEPGRYVLEENLTFTDEAAADREYCIRVTASDVVVDGQGHEIQRDGYDWSGVHVGAADRRLSNVTVRNVTLEGADWGEGITVVDVDGGLVADVTAGEPGGGFDRYVNLVDVTDVAVRASTFYGDWGTSTQPPDTGIVADNATDVTVASNTLLDFQRHAAVVVRGGSEDVTVARNHIDGCANCPWDSGYINRTRSEEWGDGVRIRDANGTVVANNTIEHQDGVVVRRSAAGTVVEGNTLRFNRDGVRFSTLGWSSNESVGEAVVANNSIHGNGVGVHVRANDGTVRIRHNEIVRNERGVYAPDVSLCPPGLEGTSRVEVHRNTIANNTVYGVENGRTVTLNATHNYWGAADGPGTPDFRNETLTDPVTGEPADGAGDVVSANPEASNESNVRFDPWLDRPVANTTTTG